MHIFLLFFGFLTGFQQFLVLSEHFTVTYSFWEKNNRIAEKTEFYAKFAANSNRFWTSNVVFEQHSEKSDKISIFSDNWKSAHVEETIHEDLTDLDTFFARTFQKFADKLYTNLALNSIPVFDRSIFTENRHAFQDYEALDSENLWLQRPSNPEQKYAYALLVRKSSFEHYEATLKFADALKRTNLHGFILDCELKEEVCKFDNESVLFPVLLALEDDAKYKVYRGDYQKDHVHDWMLTIQQPEITPLNENLMPEYRSGIIPGFKHPRDTVTILFIPEKKSPIWQNYKKFAKDNFGKYHLGSLVNKDVEKWSIQPAFITMKPFDANVKAFTLHQDITYARMEEYIEDSIHPSVHELHVPSDLFFALQPKKPFLIFYDPRNLKNLTEFTYFAAQEQGMARTAHYGAITGFDLFGLYFMNVFNIGTDAQYVMVSKLDKSWCIFTRPIGNRDFASMKKWMESNIDEDICQEEIDDYKFPIHRLNLLERYNDVEELERELTEVHRQCDEL